MTSQPTRQALQQRVRRLEEELLREREERARAERESTDDHFFRNLLDGAAVYEAMDEGEDFVFVDFNEAAERITGLLKDEVLGRRITEAFPAVEELGLLAVLKRVWKSGEPERLPLSFYWDGRLAQWTENAVFKLPGGRVVAVFSDETQRYMAEEALRESRKELERAQSIARVGSYSWNLLANRAVWSPELKNILGCARDNPSFELVVSLLHPDDRERVLALGERCRRAGSAFDTEYRIVRPDGEVRWIHDRAQVERDASGAPLRMFGTVQDITRRKEAEEELRLAHERFTTVLDGIEATIYAADMETHEILFMNRYMREAFEGEHRGEPCWKVFRREDGPCPHCTNDRLLDEEGAPAGVVEWEDRNPVTGRWCINYDRAIRWVDGRMVRLQVATDITRLKELEEERRQYETRLHQAQKMQSIGTLAGGIAHDFNNILAAMMGYTELALADVPRGSLLEGSLQEVLVAGKRATDLVRRILAFSRQTRVEAKPVRLDSLVEEALGLLRSTIPASVEIREDKGGEPLTVLADATQIHQVIVNLATNAAHAMEEGGGTMTVRLEALHSIDGKTAELHGLEPGPYARLTVADTGCGVQEEHLSVIFDPYFTTKGPHKGSGLGLSVVHGIVKAHKGHVSVTSRPGRGSAFQVYLPLIAGAAAVQAPRDSLQAPGGRERILFVDDEPAIARMQRMNLEKLGYAVTVFTSSREALDAFRAAPDAFDVVITDMAMPHMDGDRLAAEIKALRPRTPVILCTGFSERANDEALAPLGLDGFLMKPVDRDRMARAVREVLEGNRVFPPGDPSSSFSK